MGMIDSTKDEHNNETQWMLTSPGNLGGGYVLPSGASALSQDSEDSSADITITMPTTPHLTQHVIQRSTNDGK